ncbi:hypothetical protein OBBRIDRAFT_82634 [Obba rivulosa]|uniref:Uncharacterized protein n=1 Tax=Obba rivulosa TaxID=1052685 RepID=A0A8E2DK55_9APHY|nr:hypothetical protein OBBRIDRAFT_82634 [Obba rivulosa]
MIVVSLSPVVCSRSEYKPRGFQPSWGRVLLGTWEEISPMYPSRTHPKACDEMRGTSPRTGSRVRTSKERARAELTPFETDRSNLPPRSRLFPSSSWSSASDSPHTHTPTSVLGPRRRRSRLRTLSLSHIPAHPCIWYRLRAARVVGFTERVPRT